MCRWADGDSHGQEVRADGDQPHGGESPGAVVGRGEERHVDDGLAKYVLSGLSGRYRGIQYYPNKNHGVNRFQSYKGLDLFAFCCADTACYTLNPRRLLCALDRDRNSILAR
jgi:hypothetical protein